MSIRFDVDTDSLSATTGLPANGSAFTITCWFQVVIPRGASADNMVWSLEGTGGDIYADIVSGTTLDTDATDPSITANTWYGLAWWSVDGTHQAGVLRDVAGSVTTITNGLTAANPNTTLRIGNSRFSNSNLSGRVAAFKVWSAALSQSEAEAELAQFNPVRTTNLVRYHPFHVAELTDYSGNGNTLTAGSTSATTEPDPPITGAVTFTQPALVADRGTVANATAGTTSSVTLTAPTTITVGNYLVARVAVDNSGTNGAAPGFTVTDPRSNTWTILGPGLADPGAVSAGATCYIGYAKVTTAYQAADALTFNWGGISTTAKACVVEEWTNIHSASPVAVSAVTNNSVTAGSTTAVSATIVPTAADQLVYTCLATEGVIADSITYDADTTSGAWTILTRTASANATATNNQCVAGQFKVVSASGSQTWDATITSRDWAAVAVVFAPPPAPQQLIRATAARRQLGALLQM
jgi:hypothetical protein